MLTYYTKENIDKIFWAWCSQQQLNHNTIWIYNNITKQEYSIQFKSEINANRFLEMLKQGCLIDDIVEALSIENYNGKELFAFLMQNGLIE